MKLCVNCKWDTFVWQTWLRFLDCWTHLFPNMKFTRNVKPVGTKKSFVCFWKANPKMTVKSQLLHWVFFLMIYLCKVVFTPCQFTYHGPYEHRFNPTHKKNGPLLGMVFHSNPVANFVCSPTWRRLGGPRVLLEKLTLFVGWWIINIQPDVCCFRYTLLWWVMKVN
jgi:hypothetical protein